MKPIKKVEIKYNTALPRLGSKYELKALAQKLFQNNHPLSKKEY